jgi:uncharacterized membrane protein
LQLIKEFTDYVGKNKEKIILILAWVMVIVATIYWIALLTHAYNTFQDGTADLNLYSYNLYFNIHYPNIANGLQFLVSSNHISPDMLLVLPVFYLYPHSILLIYIQTLIMCLTALLVFYVSRKLIKDSLIALMFAAAFLINPGVTGILIFDFHIEFLLIPTYILTFYFYMTSNKKLFVVSLLLLLGVMEIAPILPLTMGIGFLAYEWSIKTKNKGISKEKLSMIAALIICSIVVGALYYVGVHYLLSHYASLYPQLPPPLQLTSGSEVGLFADLHDLANPVAFLAHNFAPIENPFGYYLLFVSVITVLFGFGLFTLNKLKITLLLLLPYFIGLVTWSAITHFIYTGYQYYGFTVGATLAASIIGAMFMIDKLKKEKKYTAKKKAFIVVSIIEIAAIIMALSFLIAGRPVTFLVNSANPVPFPILNGSQIYPLAKLVPQNASLLTMDSISPHLSEREYIEFTDSVQTNGTYFVPEYMLVSYSNSTDIYSNKSFNFFDYTIKNYSYELYSRDGDARLYKRT